MFIDSQLMEDSKLMNPPPPKEERKEPANNNRNNSRNNQPNNDLNKNLMNLFGPPKGNSPLLKKKEGSKRKNNTAILSGISHNLNEPAPDKDNNNITVNDGYSNMNKKTISRINET